MVAKIFTIAKMNGLPNNELLTFCEGKGVRELLDVICSLRTLFGEQIVADTLYIFSKGVTEETQELISSLISSWIQCELRFSRKKAKASLADLIVSLESTNLLPENINRLKLHLIKHSNTPSEFGMRSAICRKFRVPRIIGSSELSHLTVSPFAKKSTNARLLYDFLSYVTQDNMKSIHLQEFTSCKWMKAKTKSEAPKITKAIAISNWISNQIALGITLPQQTSIRADNIERAIQLARFAHKGNNFDVLSAIIAGLDSCSCSKSRLKASWELVPKKYLNMYESLSAVVSPLRNYHDYRAVVATCIEKSTPFVPMLSVILRDIASIDASMCSNLQSGSVNVEKIEALVNSLQPLITLYYSVPYNPRLNSVRRSTGSIGCEALSLMQNFQDIMIQLSTSYQVSEKVLMKLSYLREPPTNSDLLIDDGVDITSCLPEYTNRSYSCPSPLGEAQTITEESHAKLLQGLSKKSPASWSYQECAIAMESWNIPPSLASKLVMEMELSDINIVNFESLPSFADLEKKYQEVIRGRMSIYLREKSRAVSRTPLSMWDVEQVACWIAQIDSLKKYEQLFIKNGISGTRLAEMSGEELMELGVEVPDIKSLMRKMVRVMGPSMSGLSRRRMSMSTRVHGTVRRASVASFSLSVPKL